MRFLGLDLSLNKTGLCVLSEDMDILFSFNLGQFFISDKKFRKCTKIQKIEFTKRYIAEKIKEYSIDYIAKEGYSFGSKKYTSSLTVLAELNGVVDSLVYSLELLDHYYTFQPSQPKKFVLSQGNVKKDTKYLLNIFERTGIRFESDDEADAYMIAVMLANLIKTKKDISFSENLHNYQIQCILDGNKKIDKKTLTVNRWKKLEDHEKGHYLI